MLLDRLDQLPLRRHEIRGNPAGLLARLLARIDALKAERVGPTSAASSAPARREEATPTRPTARRSRRELEFAELYTAHDRILAEAGSLDRGDVFLALDCLLAERPDVRRRDRRALRVPDGRRAGGGDAGPAGAARGARRRQPEPPLRARGRAGGRARRAWFRDLHPDGDVVVLEHRFREPRAALLALRQRARAGAGGGARGRAPARRRRRPGGDLRPRRRPGQPGRRRSRRRWRSAASPSTSPARRRSSSGPRCATRSPGCGCSPTPTTRPAAARALTRPPIELRPGDLARLTTIARRRKLDMVAACEAALDSPQFQPEARERIQAFLKLYDAAVGGDGGAPRRRLRAAPDRARSACAASASSPPSPRSPSGCSGSRGWPSWRPPGRGASRTARPAASSPTSAPSPRPGSSRPAARSRPRPARCRAWRSTRSRGSASTTSSCSGSRARPSGRGSAGRRAPALVLSRLERGEEGEARPSRFYEQALAARRRPRRRSTRRSCSAPPRACTRPTGRCASRCSRPPGGPGASSPSRASTPRSTSTGRSPATWSC